ncbi:MAG: glycoside hydrolase family 6 protein [Solirubrobacterales bacterium]|nr:glycoside hydrolase family 6 protein [Solirubrobacterales bacterium]
MDRRTLVRILLPLGAISALLVTALSASPAIAGVANAGVPGASARNPLVGLPWGNYSGERDEVFPAYRSSSGKQRALLAKIALRPRVRWFGAWYSAGQVRQIVNEYLGNVTGGNPNVLAQMAVFRLDPWEAQACSQLPSSGQQASYRHWIDNFAAAVGSARVALILQPDLPEALCAPHHSQLPLQLVNYAAQRFSALPHTTVYIDVGAGDWPTVGQAVHLLTAAGVQYTRGFALNATHYDSTERELRYGQKVVKALARHHIGGRHFVINTAQNGRGFTYHQYHGHNYDNAKVCRSRSSRRCVTLGIPPTTNVASRRWHLSRKGRSIARRLVDAYLWIGRPWLENQSDPFLLKRALALARTTPF